MNSVKSLLIIGAMVIAATSCVSKKKYLDAISSHEKAQADLNTRLSQATGQLNTCTSNLDACEQELKKMKDQNGQVSGELTTAKGRLSALEQENDFLKKNNTNLLSRLEDLSVISKAGAESIKKSLEAINGQNQYIQSLNQNIQKKDSVNLALVMNLKRSLADINDEDVQVEVKKGVVYISLSDKMLFRSASAYVQPAAETVLEKIAKVVNDHTELDILVEGHTDNVPIRTDGILDNWDLSVKRATAVTRILQDKYGVAPSRITAGGRSEYLPKASNDTREGRSLNRRTEIILLPKLDQFFGLMAPQN